MAKPKYYCVECGADMYAPKHCLHNFEFAPAFCNHRDFMLTHHEGGVGDDKWGPCPGQASSKPVGSCPCSCHIRVSDEELNETRQKLEHMLEEMGAQLQG